MMRLWLEEKLLDSHGNGLMVADGRALDSRWVNEACTYTAGKGFAKWATTQNEEKSRVNKANSFDENISATFK